MVLHVVQGLDFERDSPLHKHTMLFDATRHEPLDPKLHWCAETAHAAIMQIVQDAEARFDADRYWPVHPQDATGKKDLKSISTSLYYGACGMFWGLHYLQDSGAVKLQRNYRDGPGLEQLLKRNTAWLGKSAKREQAAYLMGDTPIELLAFGVDANPARQARLHSLIEGNIDHPARELMWGSPGTLLAALLLHERTGDARWAELFRQSAAKLWSQLKWSDEHGCAYFDQDLYGRHFTFMDAVHGFAGTALPLIKGRHLMTPETWAAWEACIVNTVTRTAQWEGNAANWHAQLLPAAGHAQGMLMQYCHGAPGFVICLADMPGTSLADMPGSALDDLLIAGGEATWNAGPLTKGSNLCHGTGGNGYAFLKLHKRTGNLLWLERARAFAMHGIAQTQSAALEHGQMRYSLWTGDMGFAIYLRDCIEAQARFPTLDVYF